ncbi:hypothetical protein ACH427_23020 [Streptomyces sp. NPDC020379]|uniref:hypothetical protein n=1 Tax=Streptomyces sp. NPDC020379 TaxID=3365071 RepID=UPI003787B139
MFYEDVVRPVCEQFGLTLIRADDVAGAGLLSERLIRHLIEEDIVVADLTGGSPETVYGLGIRHAIGRYAVHLGETGTVPFGAGALPTIEFPALPLGSVEARQGLAAALAEGLAGAGPLMLPARVLLSAPSPTAESADVVATEQDAPGLFELMVSAVTEMEAIPVDLAEVESAFQDLGAMAELMGEDMLRATLPGVPMSAQLAAMNRFAKAIEGPSDDLEAAARRFAERMNAVFDALSVFFQWARKTPRSELPEEVNELLDQVIETSQDIRGAATGAEEIGPVIEMLSMTSRRLRKPSRKIGASIQTIFGSVAVFEEWENTARELKQG